MRYGEKILTIPPDNADNALFLGTALHTGLEKGVDEGINQYYMSYPIITDAHVNEAMKLQSVIPKTAALLPPGEFEVKISNEHFIGYIDLLAAVTGFHESEVPNVFDIYDFKYSNNISNYKESEQLHLYKYFFEKCNPGKKIRNLYFLFAPKVNIKQKKTEDLFQFRKRLQEELSKAEPKLVQIEYDPEKVIDFMFKTKNMLEADEFPKEPGWLCNYCEYQNYCQKGEDYMLLPKNERRNINETKKRKMWIYGAAFSGKTTMLDDAPDPLNLNTDGNVQFVTMQYVPIKDEVKVEGRMTKRTFAWDVFKDALSELEKKQNDFKTIIVDLLEDTREMCRIKMYDDLGIQHESDSGFGKGWDIIKTEYLSTIRRLFNLPYENIIVVSHEDISKDITKKNGQNITRIAPNIQDAIANKIAGMVDIVARVVVEDDGSRTLNFKSNEVIFGGGRLKGIKTTTIPLTWEALMKVYDEANKNAAESESPTSSPSETPTQGSDKPSTGRKGRSKKETSIPTGKPSDDKNMSSDTASDDEAKESLPESTDKGTDAASNDDGNTTGTVEQPASSSDKEDSKEEAPKQEDKPVTRTRKKRG